jgi:formylglycine-generating enzyme required for sulfatase activity
MKNFFNTLLVLCLTMLSALANNVQTTNVFLNGQNTTSHFSLINYNISWENSWRTNTNENNYDGVWIFAKFRKVNSGNWQHATINYVNPGTAAACGHTQPAGSTIKTPADGKGVWMYRSTITSGNNNWTGAKLRWNYGADGVLDNDSVEIRLFAVEMVYCPQGAYYLGSGGSESYHFRDGVVDTYFPINSESAIQCGTGAGQLYADQGAYILSGTLPAAFPKGYNAFWVMKYEFSQQQYIDFLNTIDYNKYLTRNPFNSAFTLGTHPNLTAPNPERAMGYISSLDMLSWLDWAAMRPMTELEYEKASRGSNQFPVANEYVWGNTTISGINTASNQGSINETWASGNCVYFATSNALMRCGALATPTSDRVSSGATYYGIMEMSGNAWEWAISVGDAVGQSFNGVHGDGALSANGNFNVVNWPNLSGQGLCIRGGAYASMSSDFCRTSDRYYGVYSYVLKSSLNMGGRGVRTAE